MDHREIEEGAVVDRYLLGQLPDEEAQRFERHYLSCEECLDQLELAERFASGLRRAAAREAERTVAVAGVMAALGRLSRAGRWTLAALALVLLLPTAFLLLELQRTRGELSSALAPSAATLLLPLDALRGAADEPSRELRLPAEPGWIVLELTPPTRGRYRARLERGEEDVWSVSSLDPDPSGILRLSFHSSRLEPGVHALRLEPARGEAPPTRYPFRVLPPD